MPEIGISSNLLSVSRNIERDSHLNGTTVLMIAGRLIYRKGFDLLLDALAEIPKEYRIICYIIGDGPMKKHLLRRTQRNKSLKERVIMTGNIPCEKMSDYYNKADCFIMPSLRETTGSVVLEALENGVLVITIDKFGAKNLLNGDNSILY